MCKWSIICIIMDKQINNISLPITVLLLSTQINDFFFTIYEKKKKKKIKKWTATTTDIYNNVSEWLLFNSEIFQLYHGKDKLILNEMMMSSALY